MGGGKRGCRKNTQIPGQVGFYYGTVSRAHGKGKKLKIMSNRNPYSFRHAIKAFVRKGEVFLRKRKGLCKLH